MCGDSGRVKSMDLTSEVYAHTVLPRDAYKGRAPICSTIDFRLFCLLALEDLNVAPESGAEEFHEPLLCGVQHWIHERMRDAQVDVVGRAALSFLDDDVGVVGRSPWCQGTRTLGVCE